MTSLKLACSAAFVLLAAAGAARAEDPIGSYVARMGQKDHFNSSGERLTSAAAIIRQDRANFHTFKIRDKGDETDKFFRTKESRAGMETMVGRSGASRGALKEIVNGNPLVEVTVFRNRVELTLLD